VVSWGYIGNLIIHKHVNAELELTARWEPRDDLFRIPGYMTRWPAMAERIRILAWVEACGNLT
jgi:hypothetical protein